MLTIYGNRSRFCDGVSRRNFMKIGALGVAGLSLPQLLRAEAVAGKRNPQKAVIMVYLPGGPSHQDMFDLKPDAPVDIRGEFRPIKTNVNGIQICEHMPELAKMMDKLAIIRSLVGSEGQHDAFQCLTGRQKRGMPPGGYPSLGACVSKLQGNFDPAVPPYISVGGNMSRFGNDSGFLGVAHAPFSPSGPGKSDMVLNGVTLDRLSDRKSLLQSLDTFRRDAEYSHMIDGMDAFDRQAMDVLTSAKLVGALDITQEKKAVRDRYGIGQGKQRAGRSADSFLLARRLVEAGARCVTLAFGGWDTHGKNFSHLKEQLPQLDAGLAAMVSDLHERGLDKDVSVLVWGEFGRSPKVNMTAGRDHWPKVTQAVVAGGGMRMGQVIGATDRDAGDVFARPVQFSEVFSTLYRNLGIDTNKTTLPDLNGRPQYLVDGGSSPISELVG
ncbi:MAG TPA: DUF1501 domain-containing protein [Tepidisphaeraceae bacterium]|jgi:hypothetical protein|nr:DUF1501 domain-containing protein [Tepidisphaeraceae bacterium]